MRLAYTLRLGQKTKRIVLRTDTDIDRKRAVRLRPAALPESLHLAAVASSPGMPQAPPHHPAMLSGETVPPFRETKHGDGITMQRRVITGAALIVLFPAIALLPQLGMLPYGLPFAMMVAVFSSVAANELYRAVRRQGSEPTEILGYAACILFNLFAWKREGSRFDVYLPSVLLGFVVFGLLVELGKRQQKPTSNLGTTLLGAIYVGWLSSFVTLLHGTDTPLIHSPIAGTHSGAWLVIYVGLMTWGADTAALFVGKAFGKHRLAPAISPKKTWEGAAGGFVASVLISLACAHALRFPLNDAAALGILVGVFGLIGDLCASVLKRDLGVKDFGILLPGHGGVLDRIDSIILTAPIAYYFLSLFLLRH